MIKKSKVAAIIPCCGYGTRMNMPIDKSKELLINPTTGKPLIQFHLDLCKKYDIKPLCIIRPEKTDLMHYLISQDLDFVIYAPKPHDEWMHTIVNNQKYYSDKNILLLPDTMFKPKSSLNKIKTMLSTFDLAFGTHIVNNPEKWGIITDNKLIEKPENIITSGIAWGIIGFKNVEIFKQLGYNKQATLNLYGIVHLTNFKDLTRNEKDINNR